MWCVLGVAICFSGCASSVKKPTSQNISSPSGSTIQGKVIQTNPDLRLSLLPTKSEYLCGETIDIRYSMENISTSSLLLPHDVVGDDNFFVEIYDSAGAEVLRKEPTSIPEIALRRDAKGKPIVHTIFLDVGEFWGDADRIRAHRIQLDKPGMYTVFVRLTLFNRHNAYPASIWSGTLEATTKITVK